MSAGTSAAALAAGPGGEFNPRPDGIDDSIWAALGTVRDPELDSPITELGFVVGVETSVDVLTVELRLPTYFCAPNFAYLMVADAYDAAAAQAGERAVVVRLLEHFASDEINAGVAGGRGFAGSFPGLADDELEELRVTFQRKAHRACQEQVASHLVKTGWSVADLAGATLADACAGQDLDRLTRRRNELNLPAGPDAPLLLQDDGTPISRLDLPLQLRMAKTTRISIEGNSGLCRGLLSVRYNLPRPADVDQVITG
ncbi:iron-sulfur cluster assembly protein [Streptomyces sp. SID13031]|uniref:iron-sulfur cluster assembly protein n=1 Tax=Streptomyces sp. SID13031 TaxID=2706046 RepID=UPI0013CAAE01|nr:iron-sulfur cluster assembly protein [Streptomyces sp. SID13031]NEA33647.1 iron-sulfur cluster assembly protein [Streptomyces sp. SID13031]